MSARGSIPPSRSGETLPEGVATIPSFAGRYEVRGVLGRGGTAEVFEAVDRLLGRPVAVKVVRPGVVSDRQTVARFRREARAAASLNHPNIVTVHDVGVDGDRPYIVMELVRGETLSDALLRHGRLPPERAVALAQTIAEALGAAHGGGVVHRDLKPGNVMIGHDGHVKVLDFGIAQALDHTPVNEVLGTAEYLSPEQAMGRPVDPRADVYALGVVLYEMLSGRPPFSGEPLAVAHRHVVEEPRPIREVAPETSESLAAVVHRCLRKDPRTRYRDGAELARRLRALRAAGPLVGAEVGPAATRPVPPLRTTDPLDTLLGEEPPGPRRRRPVGPVAVSAVAVVVALVAATLPFFLREPPVAQARPEPLRPAVALSAHGECGGFLKGKATLAWRPSTTRRADGYEVYRSVSLDGPYERIAVLVGRTAVRYVDQGLSLGHHFVYRLRTTAGGGMSAFSTPASADTPILCL